MRIIPAIDIMEGKCVRLTRGDYAQKKIYNEDPLEVALQFEDAGLQCLHLVDLDGAKAGRVINHKVLEKITGNTKLRVDFGGGIRSDNDLEIAFESGASQVTSGSVAVKNRELFLSWLKRYGGEKIILGADVKNGKVAVSGWQEAAETGLESFLRSYIAEGVQYVICTDVDRDGVLGGPATELYRKTLATFPGLKLIASGGVSSAEDVERLAKLPLDGVIVGKAIYEGRISLQVLADTSERI